MLPPSAASNKNLPNQIAYFELWKEEGMFIKRILMDREFIDGVIDKAEPFIKLAILLELMGKWFTKQNNVTVNEDETPQEPDQEVENQWCYCRKGEDYGALISCNNDQCPIKWFRFFLFKDDTKSIFQG